jgi:hypothetical protein
MSFGSRVPVQRQHLFQSDERIFIVEVEEFLAFKGMIHLEPLSDRNAWRIS